MKKQKKILASIMVFMTIILSSCQVFATDIFSSSEKLQFSENFKQWMELSEEERNNTIMPRAYDIYNSKIKVVNPLKLAKLLGNNASSTSSYSLQNIIPENMIIKNQEETNSCWTFASLAALESNLALKNYKSSLSPIVYDFSERHMEYATSKTFLDGINSKGFNREVGSGGNAYLYMPYLTNGTGAIAEEDLEFENNENRINLIEIQNKDVITQVNDIVTFPSYSSSEDTTEIKLAIKEHIKSYGAVEAGIYGASPLSSEDVYNKETGAIYCDNQFLYPVNHSVAIVGWDDNYSTENFVADNRPQNNGAWIIKNSWGTGERLTVSEMKKFIFENFKEQEGWTSQDEILTEEALLNFERWGYTIEGTGEDAIATLQMGIDGFMYVSYEDHNIYSQLCGIQDAQSEVTYDNIYQYDQYGGAMPYTLGTSKIYLATMFEKKSDNVEYLDKVAIMTAETYTCKVYVNPNGTSKSMNDLQQVQLKTGETETFGAGYHTIEFAEPIELTGENFVVVLEVQGSKSDNITIMMEFNPEEYAERYINEGKPDSSAIQEFAENLSMYNNVSIESGKCFIATEESINEQLWCDTSTIYDINKGNWPDFDTTIKAFTTSEAFTGIEITTPPTKTEYFEGEDFDATGMVVKAKYTDGESEVITDYTITNGTNLQLGQTSVTISYEGKTATQSIEVMENTLESLIIECPPTRTTYMAGEDFNPEGMLILGMYADGTSKAINDYTITNGTNLRNGQTSVTISYEEKTVNQSITVQPNPVVELEITHIPNKVNYVAGQNFDATGMVVKAIYENGMEKEITNYTVQNGEDLEVGQTSVTIEYEGQTTTQAITVVAKTIETITIKTMPNKTQYIQNKEELDLTGGVIEVLYNDATTEEILMTSTDVSASGFDNTEIGTQTIIITYEGKTIQFNIEIVEEPKPENSNFDNMQLNVTKMKLYSFTDITKEIYTVMNVRLENIIKSTVNDKLEYYYYLSANANETDIIDWVKINSLEEIDNGIEFEINTLEIANANEVFDAENLYLYIKEVATRNDKQQELITSSLEVTLENAKIEAYLDGEKLDEIDPEGGNPQGGEKDPSLAPGEIPHAGKSLLIVCLILAVIVIGRFAYLRYRDIQIK